MQITVYSVLKYRKYKSSNSEGGWVIGRTHGAPNRGYGYVPLRFGRGASL